MLKEKSFLGAQINHYDSDLNYEELSVIESRRYFSKISVLFMQFDLFRRIPKLTTNKI